MSSKKSKLAISAIILIGVLGFAAPGSAVSKTPPSTAPIVTLISRGNDFVKIEFQSGSSLGATGYQYSIDGGKSWVTGKVTNSAITASAVPLTTRAQVSLRGTNKYGYGPASPVSGTKRVIYLGASVTAGMDGNGHGWAREAASTLGWQYSNVSSIKSGYYSPQKDGTTCSGIINFATQVTCAAAYLPDVVVISGGYNDCSSVQKAPAKLQGRIQAVFEKLHTTFGSAEIIATPVISTSTETCLATINSWIAASAQATGAKYVTGAEQWVTGHPEWQGTTIHPNQAGHAVIATNFVRWYGSLTNSGN
jgi:lysophospholipase L1-like esterase